METDGRYMLDNNYRYSLERSTSARRTRFRSCTASSASVYGGRPIFRESVEHEAPLNVYGYSKYLSIRSSAASGGPDGPDRRLPLFQRVRLRTKRTRAGWPCVALLQPVSRHGKVRLFEGWSGYADGEQQRDFVSSRTP